MPVVPHLTSSTLSLVLAQLLLHPGTSLDLCPGRFPPPPSLAGQVRGILHPDSSLLPPPGSWKLSLGYRKINPLESVSPSLDRSYILARLREPIPHKES